MGNIYYTDGNGNPVVGDLSIVDPDTGVCYERDILGNMGITRDGSRIYRTPESEACETDLQRAACAAGCSYYSDSAAEAEWWVNYAANYRATQSDLAEISRMLDRLSRGQLSKIAEEIGADIEQQCPSAAILHWTTASGVDAEEERAEFLARREELLAAIERLGDQED